MPSEVTKCPRCESTEATYGLCKYTTDGRWVTKQDRLDNPSIQIETDRYPTLAVFDRTDCTCSSCGYQYTLAEIKAFPKPSGPVIMQEHIGLGVINPRGLEKLEIKSS